MKKWKKNRVITFCCLVILGGLALPAWSADIYVSPGGGGSGSIGSPIDLQSALDTARTNGADDIIYLQEGTYDASTAGAATFEYGSVGNDGMKVTLSGSWNNYYTVQKTEEEPSTKLDGDHTSRVLDLHADNVSFDFVIEYLDIRKGHQPAGSTDHGVGLRVFSENSGNINLKIHHVGFLDNTAAIGTAGVYGASGGGMYINSYFEATECYFKDNWAFGAGAIYFHSVDQTLSPKIDNCRFEGNKSGTSEASIAYHNGQCTIYFNNSPVITNSDFIGDPTWFNSSSAITGPAGPGSHSLTIHNCIFSDFNVTYWGGALQIWGFDATITNSLFFNNSAGNFGDGRAGAIAIHDPNNAGKQVTVTNCTFFSNKGNGGASAGGAIHNRIQALTVSNSIFWENGNVDIYRESGSATISYSNIEGGLTNTRFTDGGNNLNIDPLFVNSAEWDFHLQETSPCIDTGDNATAPSDDLEKNRRPQDGDKDGTKITDMGCYEYPGLLFPWAMFLPGIMGDATR